MLGVCSLKGGVGKTTVTLGLASAAVERGLRTVVVDLDPQGDATVALGVGAQPGADSAAVLARPERAVVLHALAASAWTGSGLDVLAGSARLAPLNPDASADLDRLALALAAVADRDLVLVDCPPSLGSLTRTGLAAGDRALVVTEPSLFAVMAVARALRVVDDLRHGVAPGLQPLGIVVNRVRPRSTEQVFRLQELADLYGPLVLSPTIPERSVLQQAQGAGRPIHGWPGRPAADLARTFDLLLERALRAPQVT